LNRGERAGGGMPDPNWETLYQLKLKELEDIKLQFAQVQEQLTQALAGNAELLEQMKLLQEKLDKLLVQKQNRDRKQFDTKSEKHNPRPAQGKPAEPQSSRFDLFISR
jgi:hypothetical protein